jgi:hypothetical protein
MPDRSQHISHGPRAGRALLAAAAAAVVLGGCAHSNQRQAQSEMTELQHAFPGEYSTDGSKGDGGDPVTLTISSFSAQLVGDTVYFVRETPSNNKALVLWQGVWTLVGEAERKHEHERHAGEPSADHSPDDKLRIVQHSFLFKEPRRWTEAGNNPEVLESMLPQDLKALPGCDLIWHKDEMGFVTEGTLTGCRPGSEASGLWMLETASLQGGELSVTERRVDENGGLDMSGAPQTMHFSRTGSAP